MEIVAHTVVLHDMQAALREDGHSQRGNVNPMSLHPIFSNHPRRCVPCDCSDKVGCSGMEMRWQHATRSKFQQRNTDPQPSESRECRCVGRYDCADSTIEVGTGVEVVPPVTIFCEESLAVEISSRCLKTSIEVRIDSSGASRPSVYELQDSGQEENGKDHFVGL